MIARAFTRSLLKPQQLTTSSVLGLSRSFAAMTFDKVKILHYNEMNSFDYTDTANAVIFSTTSERLADIIRVAHPAFTDLLLAYGLKNLAEYKVPLDSHFYDVTLPFATAYVKNFTRDHSIAFAEVLIHIGNLGVTEDSFWNTAIEGLVKGRMYRYVPVHYLGDLVLSMAKVGKADSKILHLLGSQVIKHKGALSAEQTNKALDGFALTKFGSEILKEALDSDNQDTLQLKLN